ncbi:TolC family outer membrane protein [Actibacterium lipolyticum]|uniref:Outer membrane efflux protein BepC n=1 Tax=Actibacterium lipolyticum TaxID=1524263 RepID=A0A238KLE6_9RHOB|nr:TolC family outer membrane protein [Actibacterium lipolyticum]SMX43578.1 Outer membrane efflux protein BepC precursor [Actibacterium lipolyticum]
MGYGFRNTVAGLISMACVGAVVAPSASAETLTDAMIAAYKNSNLLEQNRALLRAADEDVAQAIASLRPIISFIASSTYSDTVLNSGDLSSSLALQASLNLYDGGANRLAIDAAKETVLGARAGLVSVEQGVLFSAVQAYLDVRSALESVSLGQNNVRLITEQLRAARDRFEVGEVTRTDVSLAESRLAASQSSLVAAQGELAASREAYKAAVGRYPKALSGLPRVPSLPKSADEARSIAVRTHPSIEAAQREVTVSELNIGRARAARRPSVDATARFSRNDAGQDNSSVGLELSQTLYTGGALKSAERQALAGRDADRANLHRSVQLVEQDVGNSWAGVAVSRAQVEASDKRIRAAQLAFDGTREEARLGARTTLDVLDAEQELLDARTARVEAETSLFKAYYALLSSMGLLTVDHLKLGIPTYDPAAYYNAVKNAPVRSVQGDQLDRVLKGIGRESN